VAAVLGVEDWSEGCPVLVLRNPQGQRLVSIGAFEDSGEIELTTNDREYSATVALCGSAGLYEAPAISA